MNFIITNFIANHFQLIGITIHKKPTFLISFGTLSNIIHVSVHFSGPYSPNGEKELMIRTLWPRPHVSGNLWKRKFFFTNTACVHTYPAYFPAVSGNFWKRSPEWKFFYPIRIRIRVDGRIRKFANTLTSFSWIQSSRRALNKHGVQQGCVFFVNCSDF